MNTYTRSNAERKETYRGIAPKEPKERDYILAVVAPNYLEEDEQAWYLHSTQCPHTRAEVIRELIRYFRDWFGKEPVSIKLYEPLNISTQEAWLKKQEVSS